MKKLVGIGLIFFLVNVPPCFASIEENSIAAFAGETLLQELVEDLTQWVRDIAAFHTEKSVNDPGGPPAHLQDPELPGYSHPESDPGTNSTEPDDLEIGPGMEPIG